MSANTGGTETSKTSTVPSTSLTFAEILSQGGTSNAVSAIPATPTGKGWVYNPGAGTFATGNYSASITRSLALSGSTATLTVRFFRYSGGTYTLIGSIAVAATATAKTTYSFGPTSMGTITFASGDLLYIDLWHKDASSNVGGDNPVIYESTSATAGVASDMQVTTSTFTASGVALAGTLAGVGTLAPTLSATTALSTSLVGAA